MNNPFFSIILPTHNGEKRIGKAIESVLTQTFEDYELIVVCDSCTDDTHNRVRAFPYDSISIIDTDVHRDGLARNVGLNVARGKWILFLDDDDYFLHEYCFEKLAEVAMKTPADVIDFSFIWKGEGYKIPSPDECFVMVWCRAWRRSFIGDNRFDDAPYGSDKHFYQNMIQYNPNVTVTFWNMPIYYYNYLREGSLSWMDKKKYYLDIIVTHHDEPWELCKPFFDMMENQRCFEKDRVCITYVQAGSAKGNDITSYLSEYCHLNMRQMSTSKECTAAARNLAIRKSIADWLMFVNCDDMFADVCSLSMFMQNFPTDECDVIWSKLARECKWYTGNIYINKTDGVNFSNTDGKMYRRQFLVDNNITFPEQADAKYWYDHVFNSVVLECTQPFRIAMLTTDFYPYYKTFRADSLRHTDEAFRAMYGPSVLEREKMIHAILLEKGHEFPAKRSIMKAICREYYSVYNPSEQDKKIRFTTAFLDFYNQHEQEIVSISQEDLDPIMAEAETEVINLIQSYYNEHKQELYLVNDSLSFQQWLQIVKKYALTRNPDVEIPVTPTEPSEQEQKDNIVPLPSVKQEKDKQDPHIVVYCGTYDVYLNIVASCKSLLCNTPVDKVYFLIEDDTFPYELPDIVETINVKNQQYFPPDGPNYNNSWTYMCMIRAAFPELFPQYSKILSLDIDVVIRDNVSDLWDYDLSDYYLAGVPERQRQKSTADPLYINFGVVMMNLDKLRADNIQDPLISALNSRKFGCPEQDAYNKFCANHILDLPADFNFTAYSHITGDAQKKRIIHYAGQKFWRHYDIVKQYSDLDWSEVMRRQNQLKEGERNV